ncbi:MAG TPA: hypothetical protein VEJ20_00685 [Candidatus Eremiobacteraceae bacterium]|nr:hypothetical protein [Candidatus Eremiobacteraceae bacterium]
MGSTLFWAVPPFPEHAASSAQATTAAIDLDHHVALAFKRLLTQFLLKSGLRALNSPSDCTQSGGVTVHDKGAT